MYLNSQIRFLSPKKMLNLIYTFVLIILITICYEILHQYYQFHNSSIKTKYILIWTPLIMPIFYDINDEGLDTFIENKCEYSNCVLTATKDVLSDISQYDAIIFSAYSYNIKDVPRVRSSKQKYVLASLESPQYLMRSGITNPVYFYDNFFNWTWTYRLDSDILWRYFVIYDLNDTEVGPRINMKWLKHFKPLSEKAKKKLRSKSKAAAWIVSHCSTFGRREYYVNKLRIALSKYNLSLDRYGLCANKTCGNHTECAEMIKRDYYFYLAFENSFDADYVTEKLLKALQNRAVPIVLGGANYTRFLPPGSYLDTRKLSPQQMAKTMHRIIANSTLYADFFRWTNHYKYREAHRLETCNLCRALNNEDMVKKITVYPDIKRWWTGTYINMDIIFNKITLGPLFASYNIDF